VSPPLVAAVAPMVVAVAAVVAVAVAVPMVIDLLQQRLAERLANLTAEQRARVTAALLPPHDEALLVENFGIPVTRRIGKCLNPKTWLNDEIVNYYMQMLQEWDKRLCEADQTRKPSHFFNLFFMTKLLQNNKYTYANVKR
jgi:Ulp1 family protease